MHDCARGVLVLGCQGVEVRSWSRTASASVVQQLPLDGVTALSAQPSADGSFFVVHGRGACLAQLAPLPAERQALALADLGTSARDAAPCKTVPRLHSPRLASLLSLCSTFVCRPLQSCRSLQQTHSLPINTATTCLDVEKRQNDTGEYQEALELCGALLPDGSPQRRALEDALRLRYGHALLAAGDVDDGLAQFAFCPDADPLVLLRLFPALVPDKFAPLLPASFAGQDLSGMAAAVVEPLAGDAYPHAVSLLLPYLLSHRSRLIASGLLPPPPLGRPPPPPPPQQSQKATTAALLQEAAANEEGEENGGGAIVDAARGADAAAARQSPPAAAAAATTAVVLDTAIVGAMLVLPDSGALLRFVQQPNFVDLESGRQLLAAAGRYAELAALCQVRRAPHAQLLACLSACLPE